MVLYRGGNSVRIVPFITALIIVAAVSASGTFASQSGSSRNSPVALGQSARIDDYEVSITDVDFDATERILDASENNTPPLDDHVYVVFEVEVAYLGSEIGNASAIFWSFIGSGNTELADTTCPLYGDPLDDEGVNLDIFTDGTARFEMCAQVPEVELDRLLVYGRTVSTERVFFALHDEAGRATPTGSPAATPIA